MKYSKQRKIECQRSLFESIFFVAAGSFVVLLLYFGCDKAISPEKEFSGEPQEQQAEESRENVDGSSYGKEIEEAVSILESEEQEQLQEAAISAAEGCTVATVRTSRCWIRLFINWGRGQKNKGGRQSAGWAGLDMFQCQKASIWKIMKR